MDNQLKHKLTSFEAQPPDGTWAKIAQVLDERPLFAQRLQDYSEEPPLHTWNKIVSELEPAKREAVVVPMHSPFRTVLRYGAVAAVICVAAVTFTLISKKTEAGALSDSTASSNKITTQATASLPINNQVLPKLADVNKKDIIASTQTKNSTVALLSSIVTRKRFLNLLPTQTIMSSVTMSGQFIPQRAAPEPICNHQALSKYMVFTDGEGLNLRLPKKLFPLVDCAKGDASCRQRISVLQQKLATADMGGDFTSVLMMLQQVQQKP